MVTKVVKGHDDIILSLNICGNWLVTGGKDNAIKLWKLDTMRCVATYKGHSKHVTSLHIAPKKSNFIVSGSKDLSIKVWPLRDAKDGEEERTISEAQRTTVGHTKDINVVRVSPNDKFIASGSQDRSIKVRFPSLTR